MALRQPRGAKKEKKKQSVFVFTAKLRLRLPKNRHPTVFFLPANKVAELFFPSVFSTFFLHFFFGPQVFDGWPSKLICAEEKEIVSQVVAVTLKAFIQISLIALSNY